MNDNDDIRTRKCVHASVAAERVVQRLKGERKARMFESLRRWLNGGAGKPPGEADSPAQERSGKQAVVSALKE
jgi:hypothetical protein